MPTTKKRINITVDRDMEQGINLIAKVNKRPKAAVAATLVRQALEIQEDLAWAKLADQRRKTHKGRYLIHEEVWGK